MIRVNYRGRTGNIFMQMMHAIRISKEKGLPIANPYDESNADWNKKFWDSFINYKNPKNSSPFSNLKNKFREVNYFYQDFEDVKWIIDNKHWALKPIPQKKGLFVHVRLGDIVHGYDHRANSSGNIEPFLKSTKDRKNVGYDYYAKAIRESFNRSTYNTHNTPEAYISTEGSCKDYLLIKRLMKEFNLKYYDKGPLETLLFASQFSHKVISNGTFGLMIALNGRSQKVLFPDYNSFQEWHPDFLNSLADYSRNYFTIKL